MSEAVESVLRAVMIGVGATLVMDMWAALLRQFGVPSLNPAFLGRWLVHLQRGRWRHSDISRATPVRWESVIGWCAHYAIGVAFAGFLVGTQGLTWARTPSLAPAVCIGVATVGAPWFILQPGIGAGVASRKTPNPLFNSVKSLATHTVFGVGMYIAALATAWALPMGH